MKHKKEIILAKDIRVRYAPSPTGFYTLVMLVQHCLTTFMHVIMAVHLLSVLKILTVNVTLKMVSVHSLITCVGWELTGMKVLRHTKTIVNQSVCHFTKNILINFWQKVKPISHMSLKKSWLQSANVKKRLVKLLVTLTSSLA